MPLMKNLITLKNDIASRETFSKISRKAKGSFNDDTINDIRYFTLKLYDTWQNAKQEMDNVEYDYLRNNSYLFFRKSINPDEELVKLERCVRDTRQQIQELYNRILKICQEPCRLNYSLRFFRLPEDKAELQDFLSPIYYRIKNSTGHFLALKVLTEEFSFQFHMHFFYFPIKNSNVCK